MLSAIPDSIFSLEQLTYLQFGNSFTLYPPLSALGEEFSNDGPNGSMNKITVIPKDIEHLQNLKVLGFCFNDLQFLPKEIANLRQLDTLDISFNRHLNISAEIKTLKKMQWLKYLNVIATNIDQTSILELKKALPRTKIYTKLADLPLDTL
jgi:hypothetical protein